MEKMLTDEEIVKALQCCDSEEVDCKNCPYHKKKMLCYYTRCSDTLDFIRRLQQRVSILETDNDDYKMKIAENELVSIDWHNEQVEHLQEEIERLTREYERITYNKQEYLEWVDGFLRTHTVMKDRGEDYKMFDREWMCNTFWAKIESSLDYIIDLENQRNELQKQVDELTEQRNKNYLKGEVIMKDEKQVIECHGMLKGCDMVQQAVKDTAKEIFETIFYDCWAIKDENGHKIFDEGKMKDFAKKCYGVEVE